VKVISVGTPSGERVVARGDGSSPKPGKDATTQTVPPQSQLGIKAKPDYKKNPEPPYPETARRRRLEGTVILAVRVTALGRAGDISVKQSSGYTVLDEAALKAVHDWDFEPARVGALAVESNIEIPVRFKLNR
jgi:periplasmic protein TonB